jgi:hypothetical protein
MRRSVGSVARVTTAVLLVGAVAVAGPARAVDGGLVQVAEWRGVVPSDTAVVPMVAVDTVARVGYVLSGGPQHIVTGVAPDTWDRVSAINLDTGRRLTGVLSIPPLEARAPVIVDPHSHVLIYAERSTVGGAVSAYAGAPTVVGVGLRHGTLRVLFRVATRLPGERLAGLALTESGADLVLVGTTSPGSTGPSVNGTSLISADRVSTAGLLGHELTSSWAAPYRLPTGQCPELIETYQPTAVLLAGSSLSLACRPTSSAVTITLPSTGQPAGVLKLLGLTSTTTPTSTRFYPSPGSFGARGESYADTLTGRLVLIDHATGGQGARVFDSVHGRYVGMIKAGSGWPAAITGNPGTGRVFFAGGGPGASLGEFDLGPVVPTQGYLDTGQYGAAIGAAQNLRMTFDARAGHLLLPHGSASQGGYSVLVIADRVPPVPAPPVTNLDAGALDRAEQPGVSDSTRAASAHAFGADYQLIGGTASLVQNAAGVDSKGQLHPGTRSLRQAYVQSATVGSGGSTAAAVGAQEDGATDADRNGVKPQTNGLVDAGSTFVKAAMCSDFGSTPSRRPVVALTAQVACDVDHEQTRAAASYTAADGLLMTTLGQTAPVALPVQVGRSEVSVVETRAPGLGALAATVTATAENVTILGVVHIGRITSTETVSAHGRHGSALVSSPRVRVSGVTVDGTPVCSLTCDLDQVAAVLNDALGSRGHVDLPTAQRLRTRGGTFASYGQDPWYHAERVLDYDKADDDYAVPAMTLVVNLEGTIKSRLVVDLAAVDASVQYRVFALAVPGATGPVRQTIAPPIQVAVRPTLPVSVATSGGVPQAAADVAPPAQGVLQTLVRSARLALRSPRAAVPILLVWALLALGPYLAARRRLLLELPMLSREKDLA